jgi:hypothetical protein
MKAYYYATKALKFVEIGAQRFRVSGIREARKVAAQHNAQPWNF